MKMYVVLIICIAMAIYVGYCIINGIIAKVNGVDIKSALYGLCFVSFLGGYLIGRLDQIISKVE